MSLGNHPRCVFPKRSPASRPIENLLHFALGLPSMDPTTVRVPICPLGPFEGELIYPPKSVVKSVVE